MRAPTDAARARTARLAVFLAAAVCVALVAATILWLRPPHFMRTVSPAARGGAQVAGSGAPRGKANTAGLPPSGVDRVSPAPPFALVVLSRGAQSASGTVPMGRPSIPPAGRRLALADLRGHPVVLNFWASWCAPCRAEMPLLVKIARGYASRGVVVLGLDVDDEAAEARRFLDAYHVDYPVLTVADSALPRAYGVYGLPTTVFVDGAGLIRAREIGGFIGPDGERLLIRRLDALLASPAR